MPQTYDAEDMRIELENELATARDDLKAEITAHKACAERLKAADDVVSYLVIFGAAPTDRLAELVSVRMEQRKREAKTPNKELSPSSTVPPKDDRG
jgi:hypothetical protein